MIFSFKEGIEVSTLVLMSSAVLAELDLDKICSVSAKAVAFKDGLAALLMLATFISSALKSVSKSDEASSLPLVMYSSSSPSEELNRGRAAEAAAG